MKDQESLCKKLATLDVLKEHEAISNKDWHNKGGIAREAQETVHKIREAKGCTGNDCAVVPLSGEMTKHWMMPPHSLKQAFLLAHVTKSVIKSNDRSGTSAGLPPAAVYIGLWMAINNLYKHLAEPRL